MTFSQMLLSSYDDTEIFNEQAPYSLAASEDIILTAVELQETFSWNWGGLSIEDFQILGAYFPNAGDIRSLGPASYENAEIGLFSITLRSLLPCPKIPGAYMVKGFRAHYICIDGDWDVEFDYDDFRPATYAEMREHLGYSMRQAFFTRLRMVLSMNVIKEAIE